MPPSPPPPPEPTRGSLGRRGWVSLIIVLASVTALSQGWSWWRERGIVRTVKAEATAGDIEMFTTLTCPYCAQARYWLDRHAVPWQECNVDTSATCRARFEAKGAPGVPLMHVRGEWQLGFDASRLARTLSATPRPPASPASAAR